MPLADYLANVMAGPSSRKVDLHHTRTLAVSSLSHNSTNMTSHQRSYAEITRSESPADDTSLRSKRRRISPLSTSSSNSHPQTRSSQRSEPQRYVDDGLDSRRPITSNMQERPQSTIDLTGDDDEPPSTRLSPSGEWPGPFSRDTDQQRARLAGSRHRRAPPFGSANRSPGPEVIDLLTDSDGIEPSGGEDNSPSPGIRSGMGGEEGPEVVFISSRNITTATQLVNEIRADRRLPTPPGFQRFPNITSMMRQTHEFTRDFLFGTNPARGVQAPANYNDEILDRIDGLNGRPRPIGPGTNPASDPLLGGQDREVALDYQQAAFDIGAGLLGSEGDRSSTPPEILEQEPYKAPPAAGVGFSRNIKEDDIVVCPNCGDELALGDGDEDIKQQVWVGKQCGHAYCGACATRRHVTKNPNKRQQTAARQRKVLHQLKNCIVDGCNKRLGTKTAMVQIYL